MATDPDQAMRLNAETEPRERLHHVPESPGGFWPSCLPMLVNVAGAGVGVLLRSTDSDAQTWRTVVSAGPNRTERDEPTDLTDAFREMAAAAAQQGRSQRSWPGQPGKANGACAVALRLEAGPTTGAWVAVFLWSGASAFDVQESERRLGLVIQTYQAQRQQEQAATTAARLASVLDLMVSLNSGHRFLAVAMTFCNELAARVNADRASLGWLEKNFVRLKAMSHAERFDKKMEGVAMIESAMEEALDQDETVLWPEPADQRAVVRDHARYAGSGGGKFLCSTVLRVDDRPVAVVTCERDAAPFTEDDARLLALAGEMAVRRLADLKRADRWFGARWAAGFAEWSGRLIGPEHTAAKLLGLAGAAGVAALLFGAMDYRVDAPFLLRTADEAFLAAPFDGFIEEVRVGLGDEVKKGATLLTLDTRNLLLEEAAALADLTRYQREAEKARAANRLADMRIAEAEAEQSRVRLELARYHRSQAAVVAPFEGAVIEGDLKKRLAAPVKQGDMLFKIARTDRIYVEAAVSEMDIHELREGARGEIAFASLPKHAFPVRIERIEPAAQPREDGNVFVVRCRFEGGREAWWRSGMTGVAKLEAGRRSLLWVLTHRTVDVLRMFFWW